jgi:hypothetical protein
VTMLSCPLCKKALWHTDNGLAAHVWHDHPEAKICMKHGDTSLTKGDPEAQSCSRSVMALCALRLARRWRLRLRCPCRPAP